MTEIALIACSKRKSDRLGSDSRKEAINLYQGNLYRVQLAYARDCLRLPDEYIFILSARYGLVRLLDRLPLYNQTLNEMKASERAEWGERVARSLVAAEFEVMKAYVLAGRLYREPLTQPFKKLGIEIVVPHPAGLGYASQVQWYREQIKERSI